MLPLPAVLRLVVLFLRLSSPAASEQHHLEMPGSPALLELVTLPLDVLQLPAPFLMMVLMMMMMIVLLMLMMSVSMMVLMMMVLMMMLSVSVLRMMVLLMLLMMVLSVSVLRMVPSLLMGVRPTWGLIWMLRSIVLLNG